MACLQTSTLLLSSTKRINAAISVPKGPKLPSIRFSVPKVPTRNLVDELNIKDHGFTKVSSNGASLHEHNSSTSISPTKQLYAILESVADRVEMHNNIGEQRENWNTLLLNSINMITLCAATMAGVAVTSAGAGAGVSILALKLASTLLFSSATGMLVLMNKIQPSQLVEEQRNATRLFKQLRTQIQTLLAFGSPTKEDVKDSMKKVLALDKAYPLPLLGVMLEKFPQTFQPAVWWPENQMQNRPNEERNSDGKTDNNGWDEEREMEMREIVEVMRRKDIEDYERLGNLALKINKTLAISGPLLTGIAAVGAAMMGPTHGSWWAIMAAGAGALAATVNTLEHGGQVGMVFEMYRNSAGFFKLAEESIDSTLKESDMKRRENGEVFELKVALKLGRSLSQLSELTKKSRYSRIEGTPIDEFASKLF